MKRILTSITALSIMAILTSVSFANPAEARQRGVNKRQCSQQQRIGNGAQNGSLTNRETHRIERREGHIANQEARMRASGGGLSRREHRRLEHEQNGLSNDIYRQKHDGQHQ